MSNSSAIVCDLDGVLFRGSEAIPGAGDALATLESQGHVLVFATNNATRTTRDVADRIATVAGYPARPEQIVTSAMAAAHHLAGSAKSVFVVGEHGLVATLQDRGIVVADDGHDVDAVVVGLDRAVTYEKLARGALAVRRGARLVATNTDPTFPSPRGQVPGAGTFVAAMERATGVDAEPCGKPFDPMALLVRELIGRREVLMVGDRIETDIEFGKRHGWRTALVLTGVTSAEDAPTANADMVLASLADLPGRLGPA
jgi:HAD superfamily hydrolase (TIGR01457 family)